MAKKSDANRSRDVESGKPAVPDKDGVTGSGLQDAVDENINAQTATAGSYTPKNGTY